MILSVYVPRIYVRHRQCPFYFLLSSFIYIYGLLLQQCDIEGKFVLNLTRVLTHTTVVYFLVPL